MKKLVLLILPAFVLILALAAPVAFCGGKNVLTIANHTGANITISNVTCDGQAIDFPAGTLTNNMGTSEASNLIKPECQVVVNGSFEVANPSPQGRTVGQLHCTVRLIDGATCSSGIRKGTVTEITTPDFFAWRITFD